MREWTPEENGLFVKVICYGVALIIITACITQLMLPSEFRRGIFPVYEKHFSIHGEKLDWQEHAIRDLQLTVEANHEMTQAMLKSVPEICNVKPEK